MSTMSRIVIKDGFFKIVQFLVIIVMLEYTEIKTWTIYFVYVLPGIAKRLIVLNEQMPTPSGVNYLL
jgi:hypothetical protein